MDAGRYDEAISQYSAALSLNASSPQTLFVKRSKAHAAKGLWEDALSDANEVACSRLFRFVRADRDSSGNQARSAVSAGL